MATPVLLTVDTELTWGPYARGASWQENLARSFDPAGVGVSWQLELLREHKLKACFFVDPMPAEHYGLVPIRQMIGPILNAGQEVQLHLHPCWRSIAAGVREGADFELTCFDAAGQSDLVMAARRLLIEAGAPPPTAFRSGSYAADVRTLAALAGAGIRYDSSHNGSHHPVPSALPLTPAQIAPLEVAGIVEVPVSQIEDRAGRLRHLQLCAVSMEEMEAALVHAEAESHPIVTLVSHSFEFASRDGQRPNRTLARRFEKLCAFLADQAERFPTVHFADLTDLPLDRPARPLPADRLRTTRRMAQQLWSNLVYERSL
ncbi:polysaccharide deacetylase family protein [Allosphingosinicella deserti]|uniref:Polysaccharide deacetylase n=1 Tax=Allosphingosinicella deserti TaxID=2116704 RepID=A0A2P7QEK9_9SPHN|nr:polysaccharide deacetylase [Sphingomonas deserti]PSJ36366.1 polysaccharide deacetylase [Sphingomonas deserti]